MGQILEAFFFVGGTLIPRQVGLNVPELAHVTY